MHAFSCSFWGGIILNIRGISKWSFLLLLGLTTKKEHCLSNCFLSKNDDALLLDRPIRQNTEAKGILGIPARMHILLGHTNSFTTMVACMRPFF
jgi:hypothetical protein